MKIKYPDKEDITPVLEPEEFTMNCETCRNMAGASLSDAEIILNLEKMRYDASIKGDVCTVQVPAYRNDIMHEYDLIEDVAIGYGFKNIEAKIISDYTIGTAHPRELAKERLRNAMTGLGFLEILSIMLTSEERAYRRFGLP